MKLLFASDSFKGTLSSERTSQLLAEAAHCVFGSDVECKSIAMADGGEGTMDAVVSAVGGTKVSLWVNNPLGRRIEASYGLINEDSAIIEMASASGLTLLTKDEQNPMLTSTYGTGQMILDALERGCRRLYVAIGGSATNDGGMGCLSALGARFKDENGNVLSGRGCDLMNVNEIDTSGLDSRLKTTEVVVLCDVTNPLCGPNGATRIYAAQKGANDQDKEILESGMCNYRDCIKRTTGIDADEIAGAGAAGGLGAALTVFLHGKMQSGVETVLKLTNFESLLSTADLVITGEGRIDKQSSFGKVVSGVANVCKRKNVPVVALVGSKGDGFEEIFRSGIEKIFAITDYFSLNEAMEEAEKTYLETAKKLFLALKEQKNEEN